MKRLSLTVVIGLISSMLLTSSANAAPLKELGSDAALDAPAGVDLTAISGAIEGSDLHIQIHMTSLPGAGTYPGAGIEWSFRSGGHVYVAEATQSQATFSYILYEMNGEVFRQIDTIEGSFDTVNGLIDMLVPLDLINARKGTRISGAGPDDVDVHQHAGPATREVDTMTTTKSLTVR